MESRQKSVHEQIIQKKALIMLTYYAMIPLPVISMVLDALEQCEDPEWLENYDENTERRNRA